VGTVRPECLDRMLILGRRHLIAVLGELVDHYNVWVPKVSSTVPEQKLQQRVSPGRMMRTGFSAPTCLLKGK